MDHEAAAVRSPAREPSDRRERRRARSRDAILRAAEQIIRRDGLQRARVEDIAEQADVSVGTIYVHFSGKQAVYLALVERALETFAGHMAIGDDPGLGPLQRVLAGGEAYLRFHQDHPHLFRLLAEGTSGGDPDEGDDDVSRAGRRIAARTNDLLDAFALRIDAAIAAGEARPVDSRCLADYLWGAWNGVISLADQPRGLALTPDRIVETLELGRWLLREALRPAPGPGSP